MGLSTEKTRLHVSVIIPALNDAGLIEDTVASTEALGEVQVLVVDAGSRDGTALLAKRSGAKVLRSKEVGGRQMRRAVAEASGDVLLFLRPGTLLPKESLDAVREALSDPKVLAGVFSCQGAGQGASNFLVRAAFRALAAMGLTPFGSPWFVWRTAVEGEAGFRPIPVFEDREALARLRRRGKVARIESEALLHDHHALHRLIWTLLQVPYDMGFPWRILGKLYRKPKSVLGDHPTTALEVVERDAMPSAEVATQ